jgi:hypothetical protein
MFDSTLVFEWGDIVSNLEQNGRYVYLGRDTAYMPPLYPILMYFVRTISNSYGLYFLHLLLFIGSYFCLLKLLNESASIFKGLAVDLREKWVKRLAPLFSLFFVLYPPVLYGFTRVSIFGMSTILFILYLHLLLKIFKRRKSLDLISIGIISGLMALCRSEFLYLGIIIVGILVYRVSKSIPLTLKKMFLVIFPLLIVLAPWIYRNYEVLGSPVLSTAKYYNFVRGNNLSEKTIPPVTPEELYPQLLDYKMTEVEQEFFLKGKFLDYVHNNTIHFFKGIILKFSFFFFSYYPVDGKSYHGADKQLLVYPWLVMLACVVYIIYFSSSLRKNIYIQTILFTFILYAFLHSLVQVLPRYNLQFIVIWLIIIFNFALERIERIKQ